MATGGNLPPSPEKSSIASNSSASSTYTIPNLESFCALSGSQSSGLDCEQPLLQSQKSVKSADSTTASSSSADMANIGVPTEVDLTLNFSPSEPFHLWKKVSSCEEFVGARRSKHTIVVWNDRIYVFGGDDGRRMLNDFLVSHIRDSSWARVVYTGTPPAPRYHHSAVVFNDSMFVFGGYTGDIYSNSNLRNKNDLYEYKFTTSQWINWEDRITGDLPPARSAHGAAIFDNRLWIFAGYDGHTRLNDMWSIDLTSAEPKWEKIHQSGDSPPTCCNFPMAVVDDSMYVFSGQSGAKITNNLYQFKFKERMWIRIRTSHLLRGTPAAPQRRYGHSMVTYRRALYVYGGSADGILDNEVHCFDVDSRIWSVVQPAQESSIPPGTVFHSAAVWNNGLYIFGGTLDSLSNRSGDLYRFSLSTFPKCTLVEDLASLLQKELFTDTHFIVGKDQVLVRAHAAIVAVRSPYLRRKILEVYRSSHTPQEDPNAPRFLPEQPLTIQLEGVSSEAFKQALYSMYNDRIHPDLEVHPRGGMTIPQMLLMVDVYKLSLLLETKRLEQLTIQYIETSINEENVLLVLKNASELNLNSLKDYCLRFIVKDSHYRKVIMSSAFETLDPGLMVQIIRRQQFRSRPTSPDSHSSDDDIQPPPSLQDDLRDFLVSEVGRDFTDISLRIDDQVVHAHKAVLAARCSYFEALFRSFMPENQKVKITFGKAVPSFPAFMSLLRFIYYGEVRMPPEDSLYVFSAPNFFGFTNLRLHNHCKASLEKDVSKENVLTMLEVSDKIQVQTMKNRCLDMIARKFPEINEQPYIRQLKKELLLDILNILAVRMAE